MKLLLLVLSPPHLGILPSALGLAEAAFSRGHEIMIFFTGDGVASLDRDSAGLLASRMSRLVEKGVRLLACRGSIAHRALLSEASLIEGVRISSLGEMVDIMASSDKTLVFD